MISQRSTEQMQMILITLPLPQEDQSNGYKDSRQNT